MAEEIQKNIYDYGFGLDLNKPISSDATGVVYDTVDNALNTGSILQGGNLTLKTLSIGGLVKQVAPGDDIQAAIDAVNREGGGIVQLLAKTYSLMSNINLKSNVVLLGAGKDLTILEFNGQTFGVNVVGTALSILKNYQIKNLTIQNSNNTAGLDIQYSDFWIVDNVKVNSCDQVGIRILGCRDFTVLNTISTSNTQDGWQIGGFVAGRTTINFSFISCTATSNSSNGFETTNSTVGQGGFYSCSTSGNAFDGFEMNASPASDSLSFIACVAAESSGFDINTANQILLCCIGNISPAGMSNGCVILGHEQSIAGLLGTNSAHAYSDFNDGQQLRDRRNLIFATNDSGGTVPTGAVLVFSSATPGTKATTTTTNGDTKVLGVLVEPYDTVGDSARIQISGFTDILYANNSAASISVGDYLSTYSHAYYAKKAVTGDMAFAIALETPTTGTAQVDALLVSPRLL